MSATHREIDCRGCAHVRSGAMQEPCADCAPRPDGRGTGWTDKSATERKCDECAHSRTHALDEPCKTCYAAPWSALPKFQPRADAHAAAQEPAGGANAQQRRHSHYFKSVRGLDSVDVYRVLQLFAVTDPCIQHAVKKLLVAGGRGVKDQAKDVAEAIDTLVRWVEMRAEDQEGN